MLINPKFCVSRPHRHSTTVALETNPLASLNKTGKDIMEYTKLNNIPGLMTTFDFKKAFDSISWQFLTEALRSFNFGESFIRWVKVLYSDISSCVMNNCFASELFEIKRGVRQGVPLSPCLFIIALEIVNVAIRKNKEIEGITLRKTKSSSVFSQTI